MKRPLTPSPSFKVFKTELDNTTIIPIISSVEETVVKHEEKKIKPFIINTMEEAEEDEDEDLSSLHGHSALGEKKRRLGVNQVKALEQHFEVENKLDPDRKVRLAQDLGLQPRQVAVWFQNRRARWKTKQLERDYGALKSQYDILKVDCDSLRRDKEALVSEIKELKAKLANTSPVASFPIESGVEEEKPALMYRDGSSDSDSSGVFNDEASPYSRAMLEQDCDLMDFKAHCSPFLFQSLDNNGQDDEKYLDEELLNGEESWYFSMQGWE